VTRDDTGGSRPTLPRRAGLVAATAVAAVAWVFLGAAPASAHASLVASTPESGSVVQQRPTQVRLTFSEPVEAERGAVVVTAPDGTPLAGARPSTDPKDRTTVVAALPRLLAPGTYRVTYRVLSIDGHPVGGEIRFGYREASGPLEAATGGPGSGAPTVAAVVPRAVAAGGALAVAGLFGYLLVVVAVARRSLPEPVGVVLAQETLARLRLPMLVAVTCGLAGGLFTAVDTVGLTTGAIRFSDLVSLLTSTRTGVLISLRLVLLGAAANLFLRAASQGSAQRRPAGTRGVDPWLATGLLCSVAALVALALSGHSASRPADRAVAVLFDSLHLGAVGLWIGGLLGLGLVGLPAAKAAAAGHPQMVGEVAGALARAFSTGAQVAMLVVFATGSYLALVQVSAVKELTSTTWGEALTVKIALWVTLLVIATLNAVTLVPRMADRAARSHERWSAGEKLSSAMRLELVGGLALVGVASLMAASPQPAAVKAASTFATTTAVEQASTTARTSRVGYDLRVRAVRVGTSGRTATVFRMLLSTEGTPAGALRADAVLLGADGVDRRLSLQPVGAGEWLSDRLDVAPGSYRLTARFLRGGGPVALPVRVQVP